MRNSGIWTRSCVVGAILIGCAGISGRPQWSSKSPQVSRPPELSIPTPRDPREGPTEEIQHKQEKLRQNERQKRLVSDSDKLLVLATELHEDVAKTDRNVLSMDVIRRADEIEKLAHNVKERMKG